MKRKTAQVLTVIRILRRKKEKLPQKKPLSNHNLGKTFPLFLYPCLVTFHSSYTCTHVFSSLEQRSSYFNHSDSQIETNQQNNNSFDKK